LKKKTALAVLLALMLCLCLFVWAQAEDADKALPLLGGTSQQNSSGSSLQTLGGSSGGSSSGNTLPTLGGSTSGFSGNTSGYSGSTSSASAARKRHTLMIYAVGSDLESVYGAFTDDLNEMKTSGVDLNSVNVVFCLGGASAWHCADINPQRPVMCALSKQNGQVSLQHIGYTDNRNMADSETLLQFLREAPEQYPADSYSLVFWNHGGGPIVGFGHDELTDDGMLMTDIVKALERAGSVSRNLEWIGFDACLMGSAEVAYMMSPFARYLLFSEESIPGDGLDYSFIASNSLKNGDTKTLLFKICDDYMNHYRFTEEVGLSVIDLSRMNGVSGAMDQVFSYPGGVAVPSDLRRVASAAQDTKAFGRSSTSSSFDLFDLGDFARKMMFVNPSGALALSRAVDNAVIYHVSNIENASGLSFYFPLDNMDIAPIAVDWYREFGFSGKYASFLRTYVNSSVSYRTMEASAHSGGRALACEVKTGENGQVFTLQLTPEQMETYVRASYIIVTPAGDGTMELVRGGYGVTADENGLLSVEVDDTIHMIRSGDGEPMRFTLIETERTSKDIRYHLPFMLTRDFAPRVVQAQLVTTQENPQGTWGKMIPPSDSGFAPRMLLEFEPKDEVALIQMRYTPTYDEAGNILPFQQWEGSGSEVYAASLLVGDGLDITCEPAQGEYYVQINATDVYGQRICSPLMPLTKQ